MKRFSEQFKKKSETIRLRASERNDLRDRLTSYMEYHPLPAELKTQKKVPTPKQTLGIVSEPFKAVTLNMTYVRGFAGAFAVFMVVGIPIIAERAVPGDMLYAVKTNITEEVRASLTLSPYAKVEWETTRLERRVAEARLLANKGELTPETEAVVAQAVQKHTDTVNQEIATIRETDEDDAAMAEIAFASALSVQSDVLEGHIQNEDEFTADEKEGHSIIALADVVNAVSDSADVAQADAAPSYKVLLGKVENETTRAYELFTSVQKSAGAEEILDIERRLSDIERKLAESIVLHDETVAPEAEKEVIEPEITPPVEAVSGGIEIEEVTPEESLEAEGEVSESVEGEIVQEVPTVVTSEEQTARAIKLLRVALTDVQKLIIFMTDIDVRENVTIEELVPVTFTDEERTKTILTQLDEVLLIQTDIERHVVPEELVEKATVGTELLSGQLELVTQMLEDKNLDGAEKMLADASAIAVDVQTLIVGTPLMELTEEPDGGDVVKEESKVDVSDEDELLEESAQETEEEKVPVVE